MTFEEAQQVWYEVTALTDGDLPPHMGWSDEWRDSPIGWMVDNLKAGLWARVVPEGIWAYYSPPSSDENRPLHCIFYPRPGGEVPAELDSSGV